MRASANQRTERDTAEYREPADNDRGRLRSDAGRKPRTGEFHGDISDEALIGADTQGAGHASGCLPGRACRRGLSATKSKGMSPTAASITCGLKAELGSPSAPMLVSGKKSLATRPCMKSGSRATEASKLLSVVVSLPMTRIGAALATIAVRSSVFCTNSARDVCAL